MKIKWILKLIIIVCLPLSLFACKTQTKKNTPHKPKINNNTVKISIYKVKNREVNIIYQAIGTISSRIAPIVKSDISDSHVVNILVKEGQDVTKGETLAELDQTNQKIALRKATAQLNAAKATLNYNQNNVIRYGKLAKRGIVSQVEYAGKVAQLKVAESKLKIAESSYKQAEWLLTKTRIKSPINGTIQQIFISKGETISSGEKLFSIINKNLLRATLPFSQGKAHTLKIGLPVKLTSEASPGKFLISRVSYIQPVLNKNSRAQMVFVDFKNNGDWRPGASVTAEVITDQKQKAILVPQVALVLTHNGFYAFTIAQNKATAVAVKLGYRLGDDILIEKGLKVGDVIALHGANYLYNNAHVDIVKRVDEKHKKLTHMESAQ